MQIPNNKKEIEENNAEIERILESSDDWQEALNSLLDSGTVYINEEIATKIVDDFFFKNG